MHSCRTVGEYWKDKFGEKVYRVSIDAGFTCPTRDGSKGIGGCTFCDERGARPQYVEPNIPVKEQIKNGIQRMKERDINKYIAYFQAYTNTYAEPKILEEKYREVLDFPDVVGISISTRPDCVNKENISVISEIAHNFYTIIELGVQTMNQKALDRVKRAHTVEDNIEAITLIKEATDIELVTHIIIGLPEDGREDIFKTAEILKEHEIDGVKLHHLYVVKGTEIEKEYRDGKIRLFEKPEDYAEIAAEFIRRLPEDIVIHRFSGYCPKEVLIAPEWTSNRHIARNLILSKLSED